MKDKIHPKYSEATITCACGNVVQTRSTRGSYTVDICANCHPFYTGRQKILDTAGRVERFRKKYERAGEKQPAKGKGKGKANNPAPSEAPPSSS
jgi:large subunit ribosomal protein L31